MAAPRICIRAGSVLFKACARALPKRLEEDRDVDGELTSPLPVDLLDDWHGRPNNRALHVARGIFDARCHPTPAKKPPLAAATPDSFK